MAYAFYQLCMRYELRLDWGGLKRNKSDAVRFSIKITYKQRRKVTVKPKKN